MPRSTAAATVAAAALGVAALSACRERRTLDSKVPGAVAATGLLTGFLFSVQPLDLGTFVAVPVVLTLAAVLASLPPARRAARVDPAVALRYE